MSDVFLCRTGQLTEASRRALRKGGVIVVEVEDPSACQFIRASEVVSGHDMLWAALDALQLSDTSYNKGGLQREQFTLNMLELVKAARAADEAAS